MIRKRLTDDTGSGAGHARQRDIDAAVRQVIRVAYLPIVEGVPASAVSAFATDRLEMRT